ncbi:dethiobiotin synthase [Legionella londiniensis]|uniref:dethiobiotin synthase n=1 Tax=Legionella londiniensis TaxID=45068 RepID=UPI0008027163|nr:dethiobiotin synthase [Legionella londiniensis]
MKRFFITGTDTNCGKTYVTCQLLDYLNSKQQAAAAIKPVASGCVWEKGEWQNEDVSLLNQFTRHPVGDICPWRLKEPVSPNIAASREGRALSAQKIAEFCLKDDFSHLDYLLIEGAGGLMVPLNEQETWLDFLELTNIPVILVVGMRLGCLNHALLTAAVMQQRGVVCAGWVANCLEADMSALEENIEILSKKLSFPRLAIIGHAVSKPEFFWIFPAFIRNHE